MMADVEGYINKFDVYQGQFEIVPDEFKSFGLGELVVLNLVNHLHHRDHEIYIDNYFTLLPLLEHLKKVGIRACGTIKGNRKFAPSNLQRDKSMARGDYEHIVAKCAVNGRNRKSTKWWHRIFIGLLDRTLANSFIV